MNSNVSSLLSKQADVSGAAQSMNTSLSKEVYDSQGGWRDSVAESYLNYTGYMIKDAGELQYFVQELAKCADAAGAYDEKRRENELNNLERELNAL